MRRLEILRCKVHGVYAVSVGADGTGERVTPTKCCGAWTLAASWNLNSSDWSRLAVLAEEAEEQSRKEDARVWRSN